MSFLSQLRLVFTVARRELTSILRGRAERILFIWSSLLFVPLITIGLLTGFLLLRTHEVLHPVKLAMTRNDVVQFKHFVMYLGEFPEIQLFVRADPRECFKNNVCDAYLDTSDPNNVKVTAQTFAQRASVQRVLDVTKIRALKQILPEEFDKLAHPYKYEGAKRQERDVENSRHLVLALYISTYIYSVLWLIPAVDIIRFDFLQNNLFANLCLPVPRTIISAGKLLSGVVMAMLPTMLSGLAFLSSAAVAVLIAFEYYTAGAGIQLSGILPRIHIPALDLWMLPLILIAAVAFLHAWLMTVIFFFRGQRIAFFISTNSLFVLGPLAVLFGTVSPISEMWPNAVPFFGMAALVHQLIENHMTLASALVSFSSTFACTALLVWLSGKFYRLESKIA
jgi:hypothetical protein